MAKIVFLDEYSLAGGNLLPIKELGDYTGYYNTTPESVVEHCHGAEIVISNKVVLSEEVIAQLPDLRLIAVAATGMKNPLPASERPPLLRMKETLAAYERT